MSFACSHPTCPLVHRNPPGRVDGSLVPQHIVGHRCQPSLLLLPLSQQPKSRFPSNPSLSLTPLSLVNVRRHNSPFAIDILLTAESSMQDLLSCLCRYFRLAPCSLVDIGFSRGLWRGAVPVRICGHRSMMEVGTKTAVTRIYKKEHPLSFSFYSVMNSTAATKINCCCLIFSYLPKSLNCNPS